MGFPNIGPGELILILVIALVVLGPGKLPDVAASLGKSIREFRRAATDVSDAGKLDTPPATPTPGPPAPVATTPAQPAPVATTPTPPPEPARPDTGASTPAEPARDPNLS
jgi:sec-independent protein translocase protein TatA